MPNNRSPTSKTKFLVQPTRNPKTPSDFFSSLFRVAGLLFFLSFFKLLFIKLRNDRFLERGYSPADAYRVAKFRFEAFCGVTVDN